MYRQEDVENTLRTTNADADFRPVTGTHKEILTVCNDIANMLIEKNKSYGSSFSDPVRIFSKSSSEEQLFVRIDDKLSRLARGKEYPGDDTILDLAGYLVLLMVLRRLNIGQSEL